MVSRINSLCGIMNFYYLKPRLQGTQKHCNVAANQQTVMVCIRYKVLGGLFLNSILCLVIFDTYRFTLSWPLKNILALLRRDNYQIFLIAYVSYIPHLCNSNALLPLIHREIMYSKNMCTTCKTSRIHFLALTNVLHYKLFYWSLVSGVSVLPAIGSLYV